ncbi:MAG: hypothetical protein US31_C0001G0010 [Berkelbacteria bacterium GW2011_GWA1_36_9]|uniref:PIN domain-containing protein n=1 Tax=Berkelbacteria bacterium GW2011_GWA1_36_9 TaxID=1618331 RepID=A0A0G0FIG2_9BACT|nr:MAG: hypothetical protein US31_C0001G0010 [Berkelbacteria bacterium GW2011_GWA1_36_9]
MLKELPAKNVLKIVFDTNIYISAFLKSGFSRELFNLAIEKKIELFSSADILLELENKLQKKFKVKDSDIQVFTSTISQVAKIVKSEEKLKIIKTDPKDNIILECAVASGAYLIITFDNHLLKLKKYQKIGIIHPKTLRWIIPGILEK